MNTCALTSVANDAAWPSQTAGRRCRAAAHCATTVNGKHAIPVTNVLFGAAQAPTLDALPLGNVSPRERLKAPPKNSAWAEAAPNVLSPSILKKTPREILPRPVGNVFWRARRPHDHAAPLASDGAPGRTRTNTSVRKPDFETDKARTR
jgi:hypothetical protein